MRKSCTTLVVFLFLSLVSLLISDAPTRVQLVDISALLIAFVVPGLLAIDKNGKRQIYICLSGAVIGLIYWDLLSAYVIVKREMLMGWYVVYPVGVIGILLLQYLVNFINQKIPDSDLPNRDLPKGGASGR